MRALGNRNAFGENAIAICATAGDFQRVFRKSREHETLGCQ